MALTRRTTLVGLASLAACGWGKSASVGPAPGLISEVRGLTTADVPRWLHEALAKGTTATHILDGAMLAGACHAVGDIHHLLASGPARRLDPSPELLLSVLLSISLWLEHATCDSTQPRLLPADWEGLAQGACRLLTDPHPAILAAEVSDHEGRLSSAQHEVLVAAAAHHLERERSGERRDLEVQIAGAAQRSSSRVGRPIDPDRVAEAVFVGSPAALLQFVEDQGASIAVVWEGVWRAAAACHHGFSGALNANHTVTLVAALQRLAAKTSDMSLQWQLVFSAGVRLALDGPFTDWGEAKAAAGSPATAARWFDAAREPAPDVHRLKHCEAVGGASPRVRSLLASSSFLTPEAPWAEFVAAQEVFRALG